MILHLYKGPLFGKMLFNLSSKNNTSIYPQNVKKQQHYFTAKPMEAMCWCTTRVAAGNTNPVTLISYSFVCLGLHSKSTKWEARGILRPDTMNSIPVEDPGFPKEVGSNLLLGIIFSEKNCIERRRTSLAHPNWILMLVLNGERDKVSRSHVLPEKWH